MKTAIIFSGNNGTTEIVANMISKKLNHTVDIFDTSKTFYIDFEEYDNFVLGTNIRYGNLNKRFIKLLSKMQNYTTDKQNYYVYITGADVDKAEDYIAKARNVVNVICDYYFVGGELNISNLKFINKLIAKSYLKSYLTSHENNPSLIYENIDTLVESINSEGEKK